ncbi:Halomucin like protein [Argiope bruennichi]|uniref:Halomucin like protein n=1 Tax=Argiope bruennichi TaxID=94029 RepID=A0A8T0FID0_ARGBR|nr:Halomucin like protein [Argiope bruennichi]
MFPNFQISYIDYSRRHSIEYDPFLLLIEEVIDYSLRFHNLHGWIPPQNLDVLRSLHRKTYFNENFATTVINPAMEEQAVRLAHSLGFNEGRWLRFTEHEEARRSQEYYFLGIFYYNNPYLFQMFSFAGYASKIAVQNNRYSLVNDVVWALLQALRKILPYDEYYNEDYFVSIEYDDQQGGGHQLHDVDEGIEGTVDEDSSSGGNNEGSFVIKTDPILFFAAELIDYSLRYNNLHSWIPPVDLKFFHKYEMRYFKENLGKAVTHSCIEEEAIYMARERGFNEQRWLEIYTPSEARSFQDYYIWEVFNSNEQNVFRVFSFACYVSKIALQNNRNSLVNVVVSALFNFLSAYYPYHRQYKEFDAVAITYNNDHHHFHSQSDDEGVAASEVVSSEENNESDSSEEGSELHSDTDENATEGRSVTQFSVIENKTKERNGLDVSEEESRLDISLEQDETDTSAKDEDESDTSKRMNRILRQKKRMNRILRQKKMMNRIPSAKEEDESDTSAKEEDESDTSAKEEDESDTSAKEEDESDTSAKEEDESDTSAKEEDESDTSVKVDESETSMEKSRWETSVKEDESETPVEKSRWKTSVKEDESETPVEKSRWETSVKKDESETSVEKSRWKTSVEEEESDTSVKVGELVISEETGADTSDILDEEREREMHSLEENERIIFFGTRLNLFVISCSSVTNTLTNKSLSMEPEPVIDDTTLTIETIALFAEDCIKFVLTWHNLMWHPPVPREFLRRYSNDDLFTVEIGKALAEECMEDACVAVGQMTGFSIEAWIQKPVDEARRYVSRCFAHYIITLPLNGFRHLYLWAFACHLCRQAIMRNRKIFVSHVLTQLINIMHVHYGFWTYYQYLNTRAKSYNLIHFFLHNRHPDEAYSSGESSQFSTDSDD